MDIKEFTKLHNKLMELGYEKEIQWQENLKICEDSAEFCQEYIWVVINSGMKNQIARIIMDRINKAMEYGKDISAVFGHKGKVSAIKDMLNNYEKIFEQFIKAEDKLEFLESLSWIGKITKFHLIKNLGYDYVKPDRHLIRIANKYNITPDELCNKLSKKAGLRKATVDIILWRSANLGIL